MALFTAIKLIAFMGFTTALNTHTVYSIVTSRKRAVNWVSTKKDGNKYIVCDSYGNEYEIVNNVWHCAWKKDDIYQKLTKEPYGDRTLYTYGIKYSGCLFNLREKIYDCK